MPCLLEITKFWSKKSGKGLAKLGRFLVKLENFLAKLGKFWINQEIILPKVVRTNQGNLNRR
jgi:hypothetical protein